MSEETLEFMHPQLRPFAIPVDTLHYDPKNARKRDARAVAALKDSIRETGFRSLIIVQKNEAGDLIVRAGNGRLQAVREMGYTHIPALTYEEGDDSAIAFAIADNRTAELAEWDWANLADALEASNIDWTETNLFEEHELQLLTDEQWDLTALDDTPVTPAPVTSDAPDANAPNPLNVRLDPETADMVRAACEGTDITPRELLTKLVRDAYAK